MEDPSFTEYGQLRVKQSRLTVPRDHVYHGHPEVVRVKNDFFHAFAFTFAFVLCIHPSKISVK